MNLWDELNRGNNLHKPQLLFYMGNTIQKLYLLFIFAECEQQETKVCGCKVSPGRMMKKIHIKVKDSKLFLLVTSLFLKYPKFTETVPGLVVIS